MRERQVLLRDAAYDFLPLSDHSQKERFTLHNKVENNTYNGKLILRILVKSPLHVGSSQQEFDQEGNVTKRHMRRNQTPVIPGSSLKGAVRSIAEAVSYSCAVSVPNPILKNLLPPGNKSRCSPTNGKLCITCSIFGMIGAGGYKGKVNFGEFTLKYGNIIPKKLPSMESPFKDYPDYNKNKELMPERFDVSKEKDRKKPYKYYGNERLYYCKACEDGDCQNCTKWEYWEHITEAGKTRDLEFRGRKFYTTDREKNPDNAVKKDSVDKTTYEMLEPGSILEGEITFQNLREEEGRLLAYALNIGDHFNMKLGYGKPYGYGKIEITVLDAENMWKRYLTGKSINKDLVKKWAEEYRKDSGIKNTIERFEQMMKKVQ